jgi:uncharacterized protein YbaP (TraB family)
MIRIMTRKIFPVTIASLLMIAAARAEPAMWVIKDADSTIYLIGTMHLLKHETEWNAEKVKKTVHESTELWLEVADFDNQAAMAPLITKFGLDPEHPLSARLNEEQKKKLEKLTGTYGIPPATLEPLRPWLAAVVLAMGPIAKAGYDPKAGVERVLAAQATAEGDKIRGFETADEQFHILAELTEEEQLAFFDSTMTELDQGVELLDRLAKAWIDGDVDAIGRMSIDEMKAKTPSVYNKLLVRRNIAWAEKIEQMLKGAGVQQIAVGAAHLAGPDSVQAQLAKRGIKAERY